MYNASLGVSTAIEYLFYFAVIMAILVRGSDK